MTTKVLFRTSVMCSFILLSAFSHASAYEVWDGLQLEFQDGAWWVSGVERGITNIVVQYTWSGDQIAGIKQAAFWNSNIETAVINVPQIQPYAFMGSHDLKEVSLGSNVRRIESGAFLDCVNLETINISNGIMDIGDGAFGSTSLNAFFVPKSVTSIGVAAFADCKNLTSLRVDASNRVFDSREDCNAIIETATNTLLQGCNSSFIPNTVTAIGAEAFHMSKIESIHIHDGVTTIGRGAFRSCKDLQKVHIGRNVKTIEAFAFAGCSSFEIFFNAVSCDDFNEDSHPFYSVTTDNITTPVITIGDDVQRIPAYFAYYNTNNTIITIPNSVKSIGSSAFMYCTYLRNVTIGSSVNTIGEKAFSGCSNLREVVLGRSLSEIKECAFEGCPYINVTSMNPEPPDCEGMQIFHRNVYRTTSETNDPNVLYVPKGCERRYRQKHDAWCWTIIKEKDFSAIFSDVNGDGEVNIADVNTVIDCILNGNQVSTSDVNCDGEVNIADVNLIIDSILKQ